MTKSNSYTDPRGKCGRYMTGKNVTLPEEVSRTPTQEGGRSKACREKSAEAIVLPKWSAGRAETYGGDAEGHQNDQAKTEKTQ